MEVGQYIHKMLKTVLVAPSRQACRWVSSCIGGALGWCFSERPAGLGNLLLGVGALVGLWNATAVIDEVLRIQKQAADIKNATESLQRDSHELRVAVGLIQEQVKTIAASRIIQSSPALHAPNASRSEIKKALEASSIVGTNARAKVILPVEKLPAVVEQLHSASSQESKVQILEANLQIREEPDFKSRFMPAIGVMDQDESSSSPQPAVSKGKKK